MDLTTALTIKAQVVGANQISGLTGGLKKVEGQSNKTRSALTNLSKAGTGLVGVLTRLGTAAAVTNFAKAGVEADRTAKRLANLTGRFGETEKVQKFAAQAAETYGLSQTAAQNAVSDLYGRLRPMGIALSDIETVFKGVSTASSQMGLSVADTEGVMLQLSQALGSGKLQGDEFRSIMERLPSIGQAVANSMGVTVGQLKELSSSGKITTEEIIKALQGLANTAPPPPDAYKQFQAALADLNTEIGTKLLPALTPLVNFASKALNAFSQLPEPVQTFVVALGGIGAAAVVFAPIISAITTLGPLITGLVTGIGGIVTALTGGGGALGAIAAVFSGPVGWIALAVAAGVAIYTFRDQIAEAFAFIGDIIKKAWEIYKSIYIDPIVNAGKMIYEFFQENWQGIYDFVTGIFQGLWEFYKGTFIDPALETARGFYESFVDIFGKVGDAIKAPFEAAFNTLKGIVNNVLQGIASAINGVVNAINNVIRAANSASSKVGLPAIPTIPNVQVPQFAEGGMVTGPTLGLVGEAGPEYIVPARKAQAFAANIMAGVRGPGAIPRFAEGGYVAPAGANVNIQTGPVTQMNGTNFVTTQDLSRAVQSGVNQTLDMIRRDSSVRARLGMI